MAKKRTYKVLGHDGEPCHGGSGKWVPGEWRRVEGDLIACENGLHLCEGDRQLLEWLGPEIWIAEWRGDRIDHGDKIVVSEARIIRRLDTWNEHTARLFACDCAERVLPIFESICPDDDRPRQAIETVRRYAVGEATADELAAAEVAAWAAAWAARDAAEAAAWAAAEVAAEAAAWAASWAASWAARDAWYAGWYAGWAAAWDARDARDAAEAAARDAEKRWQAERLRQYLDGEAP